MSLVDAVDDAGSAERCMFSSSLEAAEASTCMKSGRLWCCWCWCWLCRPLPLSSCECLRSLDASCCCCFWILCLRANLVAEPDFLRPPPAAGTAEDGAAGVPVLPLAAPSLLR